MTPLIVETSFISTHQAGVILTMKGIQPIESFHRVNTLCYSVENEFVRISLSDGQDLIRDILVRTNETMHSVLVNSEIIKGVFYFIGDDEGYETILVEKSLYEKNINGAAES